MAVIEKKIIFKFLRLALKPIVRICVRNSVLLKSFIECLKETYVVVAEEELIKQGTKTTDSRISLMSGVHRKDIKRLHTTELKLGEQTNIITKVVDRWQNDPAFLTKGKKPKILSYGEENSDFNQLVSLVHKEFNPASVLFELERQQTIEKTNKGLKLKKKEFIPTKNISEGLGLLAIDSEHLYNVVEENITDPKPVPNLHRRTYFDNIDPKALPELRLWLMQEGLKMHKKANELFQKHDRDFNPDLTCNDDSKPLRVVFGTFGKVYKEDE